jgi:hypothetical protein
MLQIFYILKIYINSLLKIDRNLNNSRLYFSTQILQILFYQVFLINKINLNMKFIVIEINRSYFKYLNFLLPLL